MKGLVFNQANRYFEPADLIYCEKCDTYQLINKGDGCKWCDNNDVVIIKENVSTDDLLEMGYLVIGTGDIFKYDDTETGLTHELAIYELSPEIIYCAEHDESGWNIVSEWEIPMGVFVNQMKNRGEMDYYPQVEL